MALKFCDEDSVESEPGFVNHQSSSILRGKKIPSSCISATKRATTAIAAFRAATKGSVFGCPSASSVASFLPLALSVEVVSSAVADRAAENITETALSGANR